MDNKANALRNFDMRYYSDRTFILLAACCVAAVILALFGKLDSGGVLGVFSVAIGGWCSKRGVEEFKKADVIQAESNASRS